MPYEVMKDGDEWVCRKQGGGKVMGRHKSKEEAMAQMRALYAAEGKVVDVDIEASPATGILDLEPVCYSGGELKALDGNGRIGGHLVLWGDESQPDFTSLKDFFQADTDFWADWPAKAPVIYHHGLDRKLGTRRLGQAELKADEAGIWLEAQLKLADEYEQKIMDAISAGKMGLSSGSVSHLVRREKRVNGTHKVLSWPIFEASITPTPGEPRTRSVMAIKSLLESMETTDPVPDGALAGLCVEAESAWTKFLELAKVRAEIRGRSHRPLSVADQQALERVLAAWGGRHEELKALLEPPKLESDAEPTKPSADLMAALKAKAATWEAQMAGW